MTITKLLKIFVVLSLVASLILVFLENRDITKIYGGLAARVNTKQFSSHSGPIMIRNVNVLAPDGGRFIQNQAVLISDAKIDSNSVDVDSDNITQYHQVDGKGKYLIPGLTDSHVHLFKSPNDLLLYVANGVTQIREMIGEEDHLQWKKEIENGRFAHN